MESKITYTYGSNRFDMPANAPETAVRAAIARSFPEINSAQLVNNPDGTRSFVVRAGSKG